MKRHLGIAPGQSWIPADQVDFVVGGVVGLAFFVAVDLNDIVMIAVASVVGDIVVSQVSFQLGIRDTKW